MRFTPIFISICLLIIASLTTVQAQLREKVIINGYSSFEFEQQIGDEGKGDPNGSFDADLFDLVINVFPTDRLRIAADLSWEHGAATEDERGNVVIEYGFGEYTVYDWFKVRAGKMFIPFGIYNEIHTAKPVFLTVKEPLSTNKNHKFGSELRFYPRWGAGLAFLGDFSIDNVDLDYILLVTNGEQENTNPFEEDDNKQKSISGRLRFTPVQDLELGVSFYGDQLTELDSTDEITDNRTSQFSYGAQAEWLLGNFGLELEYVSGFVNPSSSEKNNRYAFTAMASYMIANTFTPYARYEFLDPSTQIDDDDARMLVYGLNINITNGLFLKGEFNTVHSGKNNIRFKGIDYSEFKAAVAIGF